MDEFTIRCTPEQTSKALELGAPIVEGKGETIGLPIMLTNRKAYIIPTAEEMIGWLRSKNIQIIITTRFEGLWYFQLMQNWNFEDMETGYEEDSPDEATLAAIDAALDYLTNNKK